MRRTPVGFTAIKDILGGKYQRLPIIEDDGKIVHEVAIHACS
jgi:hypothetical protein